LTARPQGHLKIHPSLITDAIMKTLQDLFLHELAVMYDAEHQLIQALPKLALASSSDMLERTLLSQLKAAEGHVRKLEQVFECFGHKASGTTCAATMGLLHEGNVIAAAFAGSPVINAALLAVAQRIGHHEIASYGGLNAWAGLLGNQEAADLLSGILDEAKAAHEALNKLTQAGSDPEAAVATAARP
jgi:ferritin-like metal-binding protein YciE